MPITKGISEQFNDTNKAIQKARIDTDNEQIRLDQQKREISRSQERITKLKNPTFSEAEDVYSAILNQKEPRSWIDICIAKIAVLQMIQVSISVNESIKAYNATVIVEGYIPPSQ